MEMKDSMRDKLTRLAFQMNGATTAQRNQQFLPALTPARQDI